MDDNWETENIWEMDKIREKVINWQINENWEMDFEGEMDND